MKITNKTIGWLITLVLVSGLHYMATYGATYEPGWCVRCEVPPMEATFTTEMARLFTGAFWIVLAIALFQDGVKFKVVIPSPFANYRAANESKRELNEAITAKYVAMAKAEGSGFNQLHDEAQVLESRLENITV